MNDKYGRGMDDWNEDEEDTVFENDFDFETDDANLEAFKSAGIDDDSISEDGHEFDDPDYHGIEEDNFDDFLEDEDGDLSGAGPEDSLWDAEDYEDEEESDWDEGPEMSDNLNFDELEESFNKVYSASLKEKEMKDYSDDEWDNMTEAEQEQIRKENKKSKGENSNIGVGHNRYSESIKTFEEILKLSESKLNEDEETHQYELEQARSAIDEAMEFNEEINYDDLLKRYDTLTIEDLESIAEDAYWDF